MDADGADKGGDKGVERVKGEKREEKGIKREEGAKKGEKGREGVKGGLLMALIKGRKGEKREDKGKRGRLVKLRNVGFCGIFKREGGCWIVGLLDSGIVQFERREKLCFVSRALGTSNNPPLIINYPRPGGTGNF